MLIGRSASELRMLGTVSAFNWRQRKTKKTCVEVAGRTTFRALKRLFDFNAFIDFIKPFGQFSVEGLMSAVDG